MFHRHSTLTASIVALTMIASALPAPAEMTTEAAASQTARVFHRTVEIDGLEIF